MTNIRWLVSSMVWCVAYASLPVGVNNLPEGSQVNGLWTIITDCTQLPYSCPLNCGSDPNNYCPDSAAPLLPGTTTWQAPDGIKTCCTLNNRYQLAIKPMRNSPVVRDMICDHLDGRDCAGVEDTTKPAAAGSQTNPSLTCSGDGFGQAASIFNGASPRIWSCCDTSGSRATALLPCGFSRARPDSMPLCSSNSGCASCVLGQTCWKESEFHLARQNEGTIMSCVCTAGNCVLSAPQCTATSASAFNFGQIVDALQTASDVCDGVPVFGKTLRKVNKACDAIGVISGISKLFDSAVKKKQVLVMTCYVSDEMQGNPTPATFQQHFSAHSVTFGIERAHGNLKVRDATQTISGCSESQFVAGIFNSFRSNILGEVYEAFLNQATRDKLVEHYEIDVQPMCGRVLRQWISRSGILVYQDNIDTVYQVMICEGSVIDGANRIASSWQHLVGMLFVLFLSLQIV